MASIFTKTNDFVDKPNRNAFDLSHAFNGTFNFGALYPVLCQEVVPGDSFSIKPTFGLNLMPMAFPVQTRMQANLHFFYVRNRNLWKDWADFIGKTKANLQLPYLSKTYGKTKTGSLHDYLGVPTTLVGNYGNMVTRTAYGCLNNTGPFLLYRKGSEGGHVENFVGQQDKNILKDFTDSSVTGSHILGVSTSPFNENLPFRESNFNQPITHGIQFSTNNSVIIPEGTEKTISLLLLTPIPPLGNLVAAQLNKVKVKSISSTQFELLTTDEDINTLNNALNDRYNKFNTPEEERYYSYIFFETPTQQGDYTFFTDGAYFERPNVHINSVSVTSGINIIDIGEDPTHSPYYDAQHNDTSELKLSALPYRAYESIYNSFYRNQQNDPFKINGVPEYNKYIPTNEGGADSTDYKLHYRNWEQDVLTTCMPSPQQGIAPLVGITTLGDMTFKDENGVYHAKAKIGEDGDTITGVTISSNNMPLGTKNELMNLATSGITISDLRNVNSLQRWLEKNMRRGFRYKEQILSHYGVDAKYDALDMPEFLGGMSEPIYINKVDQTADTKDAPLGSYAGQGSILATSKHSINHYCDEHGYIIGILSVSPVPNYSQMLPKHFIKQDALDYFFPEFGHIGMQPITYKQVTPVQSYNSSTDPNKELNKVFGYQRAWYEYLANVDQVHGLFRTSLRNFLINRIYDTPPELSESFLKIDPKQTNQIFTIQDVGDKIQGQIYFDIVAKRPIPTFGIPRLE